MALRDEHTETLVAYVRLYAMHYSGRKGTHWNSIKQWSDEQIRDAMGRSRNYRGARKKVHAVAAMEQRTAKRRKRNSETTHRVPTYRVSLLRL